MWAKERGRLGTDGRLGPAGHYAIHTIQTGKQNRFFGKKTTVMSLSENFLANCGDEHAQVVEQKKSHGNLKPRYYFLTEGEIVARRELVDDIRRVQSGITNMFPSQSPQWKEFHIGTKQLSSTPKVLAIAADVSSAFAKYKDVLAEKSGIIQKDVDELVETAERLRTLDTKHEVAKKKDSPEATRSFAQAMDAVLIAADFIHTAAGAEFKKEPEIAKQFKSAKKLRKLPEPKKTKQAPPTPPSPES